MEAKNRKSVAPNYMKDFSCIGSACEDTCCAGWYIAIDEATYKKYQKVKDKTMRARLDKELVAKRSHATPEHVAKIKLKNGRCAFLSQTGWCDIYSSLGENYLSQTCTLYPRTINKVNDTLEYSLTFSCPEAARVLLLREEAIKFETVEQTNQVHTISADILVNTHKPQKWQDYFLELRTVMISIVQNRVYTIEERLYLLREAMWEVEYLIQQHALKKLPLCVEQYKQSNLKNKLEKYQEDSVQEAKKTILLISYLQDLNKEKKFPSERYMTCFEEMLSGLGVKGEEKSNTAYEKYQASYQKYYKPFILEKAYILENYLVNYIVERCAPLDGETPFKSYEKMYLYYRLIKLHLIGLAATHQGITQEQLVKFIQSFSKVFDHNEKYISSLMQKEI